MSKTTQKNKAVKAEKETKVEVPSIVEERKAEETTATSAITTSESTPAVSSSESENKKVREAKKRGKKYLAAKKKVDPNKYYSLLAAVKLAQSTSFAKFTSKLEVHVTVTEEGNLGEIAFPHLATTAKKIVIANDSIIADIKAGKIEFDILVATPAVMPKLLSLARVLGPKGLMPNPKNGTLSDKPEEAVKRLSVAKTMIKTDKKNPVVHLVVGLVDQSVDEISANIVELIKVIRPTRIRKLVLCATMGPAVKIEVEK